MEPQAETERMKQALAEWRAQESAYRESGRRQKGRWTLPYPSVTFTQRDVEIELSIDRPAARREYEPTLPREEAVQARATLRRRF